MTWDLSNSCRLDIKGGQQQRLWCKQRRLWCNHNSGAYLSRRVSQALLHQALATVSQVLPCLITEQFDYFIHNILDFTLHQHVR
jgi:hypothetical protein